MLPADIRRIALGYKGNVIIIVRCKRYYPTGFHIPQQPEVFCMTVHVIAHRIHP